MHNGRRETQDKGAPGDFTEPQKWLQKPDRVRWVVGL